MLGSAADADDVVQDAWMRWLDRPRAVRDPAAFLATTTTRLALNVGQSARARRETHIGSAVARCRRSGRRSRVDAEQHEAVERALSTILERLSPTERAVYVLREAFDYPHRQIAAVVGLSEANARQLVTRARRQISRERSVAVDAAEHGRLVDAFVAAAQTRRPRTARAPARCELVHAVASAARSSLRELMPSLVKTLRRWYSTVRGLMNSWAPISGFVCPSRGEAGDLLPPAA